MFEATGIKVKVCGMKDPANIREVAALGIDFMGFIFYEPSPRNFNGIIPEIGHNILKTGVFVDEETGFIAGKVKKHALQAVQLHGSESPQFCRELKQKLPNIKLIKAFAVDENFDFGKTAAYQTVTDLFVFDTKGAKKGGTGKVFDWRLLRNYRADQPFLLSGGIGPEAIGDLEAFFSSASSRYCMGVDLNSRFEREPGLKNTDLLKEFIEQLKKIKR